MSSADQDPGRGAGTPRHGGSAPDHPRPLSRDDLFSPDGPFGRSRSGGGEESPAQAWQGGPDDAPGADDEDERTQAYPAQGYPTQGYPTQGHPTQGYPAPGHRPQDPYGPQGTYRAAAGEQAPYQQAPYQRSGYQEEYPEAYREDLYGGAYPPSHGTGAKGRQAIIAVAAALAVVLVGAVAAFALFDGDDKAAQASRPTARPSAGGPQTAEPSQAPSETGAEGDYAPIPEEPWTDGDLDLGMLTEVKESGDDIVLVVNRVTYYTGDEAKERNGGEEPDGDFLMEDNNPRLRTFVLAKRAHITAGEKLGGAGASSDGTKISAAELLENAEGELDGADDVAVWLRHVEGEDGPVTALAEYALP